MCMQQPPRPGFDKVCPQRCVKWSSWISIAHLRSHAAAITLIDQSELLARWDSKTLLSAFVEISAATKIQGEEISCLLGYVSTATTPLISNASLFLQFAAQSASNYLFAVNDHEHQSTKKENALLSRKFIVKEILFVEKCSLSQKFCCRGSSIVEKVQSSRKFSCRERSVVEKVQCRKSMKLLLVIPKMEVEEPIV